MKATTYNIATEASEKVNKLCAAMGNLIKQEREKKGLSIRKLASISGSSSALISDFENGNRLPLTETLIKFAIILEIPFNKLFGISENSQPNLENSLFMMGLKRDDVEDVLEFVRFKLYKENNKKITVDEFPEEIEY